MLTSIIIPCWNSLKLTRVCLKQLLRWTSFPYELIIVDNGSEDGSTGWLRDFKKRAIGQSCMKRLKRVKILTNKRNQGYTAAINRGLRAAKGEYYLFGNTDVAVTPLWLEGMIEAITSGPRIGGITPFSNPLRLSGEPLAWSYSPWYKNISQLERFAAGIVNSAGSPVFRPARGLSPGFWFLTSRSVIDRVGAMDERFSPGGYEDLDLQLRIRRAGYRLGFAGRTYVHHIWFGSCESNGLAANLLYNRIRRRLLYKKHPQAARLPFEVISPLWVESARKNIYTAAPLPAGPASGK